MKFDYIIVGAGSAGCVLANRLSADPAVTVLLLEAGGPDRKMEIHIPAAYAKLNRTEVDWGYSTEPQEHVLNRRLYLPRGKTLGGSSSINAMAYVRGNRADYDEWAALGNPGWSYEEVLPYFVRSEHNEQITNQYHGHDGELNVTFAQRYQTPVAEAFVAACVENGLPENRDYNGAEQRGAGLLQFTIKNQKRHSASAAFLRPVMSRPNLTIITHALTERIIVQNDRAVGVVFRSARSGQQEAMASKEVILSAGVFNSPQLLMLSGVGDAEMLKANGIAVKKHLPGVGQNLQDHLFFPITTLSKIPLINNELTLPRQLRGFLQYTLFKSGPLTISPLEAVAFLKVTDSPDPVDMQFHFSPVHLGRDYVADLYDLDTLPRTGGYMVMPILLKPKSRGYVSLKSANAADAPRIQPNFFSEEDDLKMLLAGTKKALEIVQAKAFDDYRQEIIAPPDLSSEEALILHIKKSLETVYHPVGTCKMGVDEGAVVDEKLRVRGIEGLRVVDASIMPRIVAGNTNAVAIMIGEKGADMILGK
ncbi:GMC family oxidoreductase [Persicitalea jodogahamensis]|uniref:Choline dehydrogenase n=1 Tax=Persicitalea jodogahamensis TaxID=402147 RepID=A0A8J3D7K9_9BACT|nr:GMC family oxidoreductase N-terminal domain-containing protein [Persicitalea jodogahamensis]GHB85313.1 choline dehydrogenase [Persicitalea jodogahamensis]